MGKFTVEPNVTKKTTHLVTFDSKRTQKFLRAIIRGLWIVDYDWVTASLQAGNWLLHYIIPLNVTSYLIFIITQVI